MSKGKIPVSKAKTAYGLLSEIAALSLAEPKRMRMGVFLATNVTSGDWGDEMPACRTIGCIAGWTTVLTKSGGGDVSEEARLALGLTTQQSVELFLYKRLCQSFGQGTARHSRRVVSHIRRFQKKYKAQLLAKKV